MMFPSECSRYRPERPPLSWGPFFASYLLLRLVHCANSGFRSNSWLATSVLAGAEGVKACRWCRASRHEWPTACFPFFSNLIIHINFRHFSLLAPNLNRSNIAVYTYSALFPLAGRRCTTRQTLRGKYESTRIRISSSISQHAK